MRGACHCQSGSAPARPCELSRAGWRQVGRNEDGVAPGKGEEGELEAQGCKRVRLKNFWGPGDGYQGINSVFEFGGFPFELQFHTPEVSFQTWMNSFNRCSYRGAVAKAFARSQNGNPLRCNCCRNQSIEVKEEECHVSYEKFRTAHDVGKAIQCVAVLPCCRATCPRTALRGSAHGRQRVVRAPGTGRRWWPSGTWCRCRRTC
jgi:hypothetical protein